MGTLTGHLLAGSAFSILGLWHLFNTAASYRLSGHSSFSSRIWFPSPFIKHLELLLLLLLSLVSTTLLLFLSPSSAPSDLEHATMFLHLFIYSSAALAADLLPSPSSSSIAGLLAASAFAQELLLLHFHSIDHAGLEGHYHGLMQIVVAACLVSTAATVGFPTSYVAAAVRSAAVVMQGMWF
ncbi:transmembrane protein 45B-like, partial [Phalaenopsis equestris]|uniref:transmembrane protein 45B-like n=1 Tax=Phalaenopsis equestris TaxID=78828 RepID=UPI0009E1C920